MNPRSTAIAKAIALHPMTDPAAWVRWVESTDELTDEERLLVLTAGADDLLATAARLDAEADQLAARARATGEFMEGLRPYYRDEAETIGDMLARARAEDPAEHRRLVSLAAIAFPGGTVTVAREVVR